MQNQENRLIDWILQRAQEQIHRKCDLVFLRCYQYGAPEKRYLEKGNTTVMTEFLWQMTVTKIVVVSGMITVYYNILSNYFLQLSFFLSFEKAGPLNVFSARVWSCKMLRTISLPVRQWAGQFPQAHPVCLHVFTLWWGFSFACAKEKTEEATFERCCFSD